MKKITILLAVIVGFLAILAVSLVLVNVALLQNPPFDMEGITNPIFLGLAVSIVLSSIILFIKIVLPLFIIKTVVQGQTAVPQPTPPSSPPVH